MSNITQILKDYESRNLDFVGFYHDGMLDSTTHTLFEGRLAGAITGRSVPEEIELYSRLASKFHKLMSDLSGRFRPMQHGVLIRIVFDLEPRAFFYYHIHDGAYVFGATVDQTAIDNNAAEHEMRSLVAELECYTKRAQ